MNEFELWLFQEVAEHFASIETLTAEQQREYERLCAEVDE